MLLIIELKYNFKYDNVYLLMHILLNIRQSTLEYPKWPDARVKSANPGFGIVI